MLPSDMFGQSFSNDGKHFHGDRVGLITKAAALLSESVDRRRGKYSEFTSAFGGIADIAPLAIGSTRS